MQEFIFPRQNLLRRIIFVLMVSAAARSFALTSDCTAKSTNQTAIVIDRSNTPINAKYEMTAVHWDPVLKQNWAVLRMCKSEGSPAMLVPLKEDIPAPTMSPFPVIHAGEIVHILQRDTRIRMELTGLAEENGTVGGRIRVHILSPLKEMSDSQDGWGLRPRALLAIIRGPHQVEIVQ